jgi:hypothetical protein
MFIGHSLGGILLKQIYVATHKDREAGAEFRSLNESIRAYVFLATPQKSIGFEDFGALFRSLDRDSDLPLGGNETDLEEAFVMIGRINDDFRRLGGEELPASCLYEKNESMIGLEKVGITNKYPFQVSDSNTVSSCPQGQSIILVASCTQLPT